MASVMVTTEMDGTGWAMVEHWLVVPQDTPADEFEATLIGAFLFDFDTRTVPNPERSLMGSYRKRKKYSLRWS